MCWEFSDTQERQSSCPHGVSSLAGKTDITQVVTGIVTVMKEKSMRLWESKRRPNLALEPVDMLRGPPTL